MTKKLLRPSKILSPVAKVLTLLALSAGGVSAHTPSDLVKGRDEGQRNQQTKKVLHTKQPKRQKEDELLLPMSVGAGTSASHSSTIKEVNAGVLVPFFGVGADSGYAFAKEGSESAGAEQPEAPKDIHSTRLLNQDLSISGKLFLEGKDEISHGVSGQDQYAKWNVGGGIYADIAYPSQRWASHTPAAIANTGIGNNRLYITTEGDIDISVSGYIHNYSGDRFAAPRAFLSNVRNGVSRLTANNISLMSDDIAVQLTSTGYIHYGQQLYNVAHFTAKDKILIQGTHRAVDLSGKSTGFIKASIL